MQTLTIQQLTIGDGIPKICVPIVANSVDCLKNNLQQFNDKKIDLIEWRMDYLDCVSDTQMMCSIAKLLRKELPNKPILATFRSQKEGGEQFLSYEDYCNLLKAIASTDAVDLIDYELFSTEEDQKNAKTILELQHLGVKVIISNHDFQKTPNKEEIVARLEKMEALHGDIAKIAVMPHNSTDVLTLLDATNTVYQTSSIPIVTMSMGKLGVLSRISGATFGSSITFAALNQASAPGQIPVEDLYQIRNIL